MNKFNTMPDLLKQAGLSDSEVAVYKAGHGKQQQTSGDLVKAASLPRPTVMGALKNLRAYGLCTVQRLDGRSFIYIMQPIWSLSGYLGDKIRTTDALIEQLVSYDDSPITIATRQAVGQAEVQELIELALRCHGRKWQIIAPKDNALAHMPEQYIQYFKAIRHERQIESQTLWSEKNKKENMPLHDLIMRKPRYIPKNIATDIPSLLLAFDDKLLAIDGTTNPSAVLICNKSIVQTFTVVFELAWRSQRTAN